VSRQSTVGFIKRAGTTILVTLLVGFGCRGQKETPSEPGVMVGVVYVTGNEPFTNISVQTEDGRMHTIHKDTTALYAGLWKLQGQKLRIRFRPVDPKSDTTHMIIERYEIVNVQ
jgi:hypothetical protein